MSTGSKSYTELLTIQSFEERIRYLQLYGRVSDLTFGPNRFLNQQLYLSQEWKRARNKIILRDSGFDLGHPDYKLYGSVIVHHINPITVEDVVKGSPLLFDPENLITMSDDIHKIIHYHPVEYTTLHTLDRTIGDTKLW